MPSALTQAVLTYGLPLIFVIVLLEQLGAPIPAIPVLVVAGALSMDRDFSAWQVLLVALVASLIADGVWFLLGRSQGHRVLKTLCRISLSPDSCVRQTESVFERWGMPSLLVAKFIPGFSTVAPPMAGATGAGIDEFLLFDGGGALIWAGAGIVAGMIFHRAIDRALAYLASFGSAAFAVLGAILVAFVAVKWWQRRRFYKVLRMARISVEDLRRLMDEGKSPIVLDVDHLDDALRDLRRDREIVLYCTWPNEASAARVARMLMDRGFTLVRPLAGGLEAWVAAGYAIDAEPLIAIRPPGSFDKTSTEATRQ